MNRGMTLVELLVVLGVIGAIVGMGVPGLVSYAQSLRLKTATRKVVGLLSLARSLAISTHAPFAVEIDQARGELTVVNLETDEALEQVVRLPSVLTLDVQVGGQSSSESQIVFRPTGSLEGRTVSLLLADREKSHTITVMGTTGAVAVE